jgi:hypothetical protein
MKLILDIGSGNTLTSSHVAKELIDAVIERDTKKHEIIFKTQLFVSAPPNKPLSRHIFWDAWDYAKSKGYKLTSSIFDIDSLQYLMRFNIPEWPLPFIKIACRPDLYWLIGEIPRKIPVYVSYEAGKRATVYEMWGAHVSMLCVPKYPALYEEYQSAKAISDHTIGWQLYKDYQPEILEKHVCLDHTQENPDAGPFAVTPEELEGIL